jgi:hypothetical protein
MLSGPVDFPTTRWTLVAAAGGHDQLDCRRAHPSLYKTYCHPLYVYARRSGDSPDEAKDHTQEFFARFIEHDYFDRDDDALILRVTAGGRSRTYSNGLADSLSVQPHGANRVPHAGQDKPLRLRVGIQSLFGVHANIARQQFRLTGSALSLPTGEGYGNSNILGCL